MAYEDYLNLTDEDFVDLPPLVAAGEVREEKLAEVIDRWATQTADLLDEYGDWDSEAVEQHPATLKRIDLRDDNPNAAPIDLGKDLLVPLAKRLAAKKGEEPAADENAVEAGGDAHKPRSPRVIVGLLGCRIPCCQCRGLSLNAAIELSGSQFSKVANFFGATFSGYADFNGVTFSGDADFNGATFSGDADFLSTTFSGNANFPSATFIGYAGFDSATFIGYAGFHSATFSRYAFFPSATFSEGSDFYSATFSRYAGFDSATFSGDANFGSATLSGYANFGSATFSGGVNFGGVLCRDHLVLSGADLRYANIFERSLPLRRFENNEPRRLWLTDFFEWRWVRRLGGVTALTRVSYLALGFVPLLAGLWGPARAWILAQNQTIETTVQQLEGPTAELKTLLDRAEQAELPVEGFATVVNALSQTVADFSFSMLDATMPTGWIMAFLAAFAVVVAQFIYQIFAPELIQQNSEEELIKAANERNRLEKGISTERLRQATDHLRSAAEALPHRHSRWFVKRQRRIVWIPDNVEHFDPPEQPNGDALEEDHPTIDAAAEAGAAEATTEKPADKSKEVSGEDRKRIAIEEGEKAQYALAAFEKRSAAWVSGGLYVVAGFLTLAIVVRQIGHIVAVSPAAWAAPFFLCITTGWLVTVIGWLLLATTVTGAFVVRRYNPIGQWLMARINWVWDLCSWLRSQVMAHWPGAEKSASQQAETADAA